MITFEAMYRSPRWRGPMVVAYAMFDGWPSACEWMVPNSDKEEQIDPRPTHDDVLKLEKEAT